MAVQHLLDAANVALEHGRHDEAIEHLRAALLIDATYVPAYFALADLYEAKQEYIAVLQLMRALADKRLDSAEVWLRMGRAVGHLDGERPVAKRLLQRAAAMAKEDSRLLTEVGRAMGGIGEITLAANVLMQAATHDISNPAPYRTLAEILDADQRFPEALSAWQTTLALAPYDVGALQRTAELLMRADQHGEARTHLHRALSVRPDDLRLRARLGYACYGDARYEDAVREFSDVLAALPELTTVRAQRARALYHAGRAAEAIADLALVLEETPDDADAWVVYGAALADLGRNEKAEGVFRLTLEKAPECALAWAHLGMLCTHDGRVDEGYEHLEKAIALEPRYATAYFAAAWSERFTDAERLEELLATSNFRRDDAMMLHFALARIYDRRGEVEKAAAHATTANGLKRVRFDRSAHLQLIEELERAFPAPASAASGRTDVAPVFVVGMPRSGTSLVTQVLGAHPELVSIGESTAIPRMARDLALTLDATEAYPRCVPPDGDNRWESLADAYVATLPGTEGKRTIDKLPSNFLHLGFIERMFPNAKVVYVTRDLADTALSLWMTPFLRDNLPYAYDLDDLATFAQHHERIMKHWVNACGLEVTTVAYEDMARKPDETIRGLLESLALPWDDACLSSHESTSPMETASAWQVRKPIYASSVGRAEKYMAHLGPIAALVGEPEEDAAQAA